MFAPEAVVMACMRENGLNIWMFGDFFGVCGDYYLGPIDGLDV